MGRAMWQRQAETGELALEYAQAPRRDKGGTLDSVMQLMGQDRRYAARMLQQRPELQIAGSSRRHSGGVNRGRTKRRKGPRNRPREHGKEVPAPSRGI